MGLDIERLRRAAIKEAEHEQMRRVFAEKVGVTDDEMKAYAVSLTGLINVGVTATPEQIMAVAATLGPGTCGEVEP